MIFPKSGTYNTIYSGVSGFDDWVEVVSAHDAEKLKTMENIIWNRISVTFALNRF